MNGHNFHGAPCVGRPDLFEATNTYCEQLRQTALVGVNGRADERERLLLAPLTWDERNRIGCYCPALDVDDVIHHHPLCLTPKVEKVLAERALVAEERAR